MRWLFPLVVVSVFSITLHAEVFDLGDLKQYDPKSDKAPDGIEPDSIYVIEEDKGFKILFGQDVKEKVNGAIQGCGELNDQCFKTINSVLKDAHVQLDHQLEPRQLLITATAVGEAFKTLAQLATALGALVMAINALDGKQIYDEKGSHWSDIAASNVAKLPEGAPITISAAGSAIATVTQAPEETTLEGSTAPIVTVVESASDGFEKGDLSGILDVDLAGRLDEFMHRSKECRAGSDFDKDHPEKRRASGTYGQALCAAQGVMQGATANGPFNDLVLLDPAGVHFGFAKAAGAAQDVANILAEFVAVYAPLTALPEDLVHEISIYVLALAIDTIVDNVTLGERNRIQATMVTTADSPSSTTTGCPEPDSLICGIKDKEDCPPKLVGEGDKRKAVCEKGKHKDCECSLTGIAYINYADEERQKFIGKLNELFENSKESEDKDPEKKAKCSEDKRTRIPAAVFSSDPDKVYGHFCKGWPQGNDMSMTVDMKGKDVTPKPRLRERIVVDSDDQKKFVFDLSFKKGEGSGKCSLHCNEAFDHLSKACAIPSLAQLFPQPLPIASTTMYEEGSLDVGCGVFGYKIKEHEEQEKKEELTELKEFKQFCYKKDDFEPLAKAGVNKDSMRRYTGWPCTGVARRDHIIKKGDKSTFIQWFTTEAKVPYQFNIWWKDGCTLADDRPTEAYAINPLWVDSPDPNTCFNNLRRNWKNCNNGGVGGKIQIGCLIYEFKADKNKRTW